MIVQVKDDRNNRFRAVLKGTNAWIDFDVTAQPALHCQGTKGNTTEQYEFRVLLTLDEIKMLTDRGPLAAARQQASDGRGAAPASGRPLPQEAARVLADGRGVHRGAVAAPDGRQAG